MERRPLVGTARREAGETRYVVREMVPSWAPFLRRRLFHSKSVKNPNNAAGLERLADLIRERNANEVAITGIVGRPAQLGHIGEYIASRIFDIELEQDAAHRGSDGQFRSGPFAVARHPTS